MFMFEKAVVGSRRYWAWMFSLLAVIGIGLIAYLRQFAVGLQVTGMSRDVVWGLYIAQFTFFVGVAASAVVVVLPYYLHNYKVFSKITILGEFLAISAVTMCSLFIFVDMGQPTRILNVILYPTLHSMMFWDMISLGGYLFLNVIITVVTLTAERNELPPPSWIKPIIILSIPWAISIHTVTAFLYSGLPGRAFWLTAIMAPRFLASAFAAGPALLILLCFAIRKLTGFDVGREPIQKLAVIITYAMILTVFFFLLELFTTFYSRIPDEMVHFQYLLAGLQGHHGMVPWMWSFVILAAISLTLLIVPRTRHNERTLAVACGLAFVSLWIEKGVCQVIGGFIPSPLGAITEYVPKILEVVIVIGIWAVGMLMTTLFYKIALSVREGYQE